MPSQAEERDATAPLPLRLALFGEAALWPVGLTFLDRSGVTLWGTGGAGDERDRLLTQAGHLVLAGSEADLRAYVAADGSSDLADLPGYGRLKEGLAAGGVSLEPVTAFGYRAVADALTRPPSAWTHQQCAEALDALNMLSDVAWALGDEELTDAFDGDAFTELQERLTFVSEDELPDALVDLDLDGVLRLVGMAIDRVERQIR